MPILVFFPGSRTLQADGYVRVVVRPPAHGSGVLPLLPSHGSTCQQQLTARNFVSCSCTLFSGPRCRSPEQDVNCHYSSDPGDNGTIKQSLWFFSAVLDDSVMNDGFYSIYMQSSDLRKYCQLGTCHTVGCKFLNEDPHIWAFQQMIPAVKFRCLDFQACCRAHDINITTIFNQLMWLNTSGMGDFVVGTRVSLFWSALCAVIMCSSNATCGWHVCLFFHLHQMLSHIRLWLSSPQPLEVRSYHGCTGQKVTLWDLIGEVGSTLIHVTMEQFFTLSQEKNTMVWMAQFPPGTRFLWTRVKTQLGPVRASIGLNHSPARPPLSWAQATMDTSSTGPVFLY